MPELPDVEIFRKYLDTTALHKTIKTVQVFEAAVEARADPDAMPDGFLLPRRREGADCPRCGGKIEKIKVSGRNGYMCPDCQKRQ
jgi:formamidopyrimidine-DNA glycosylase